jgi:dTDP-4-dehydrorhamnose 3,5-epimerase
LVTCVAGAIVDVIVDIRRDSPTFGRHLKVELTSEVPRWFWVPAGFAHGFAVTSSSGAGVMYKVDQLYAPQGEGCLLWNDPDLNIEWPVAEPVISAKDAAGISFTSYSAGTGA